jgi:hypothetical protein
MVTAKEIRDEEQAEKDHFVKDWEEADDKRLAKILSKIPEAAREGFTHLVKTAEFISPEWEREWGNHDVVVAGYDEFFRGDSHFKAVVSEVFDAIGKPTTD